MEVKPTLEQALLRLRLNDALSADLADALDEAHAEAEAFLDGTLYASAADRTLAADPRGIVVAPDIISAQLLLADALVGANDVQGRDSKRTAAFNILRRHRNVGC